MALTDINKKLEIITLPPDNNHSERMGYRGIDLFTYQEEALQILNNDTPENIDQTEHTVSNLVDAEVFYAPYILLFSTPTLNLSDLLPEPEIYKVNNYDDIYSNIMNRFEILDI